MKDVILLPTYNERENISVIIPKIFEVVPHVHVTVIDDSSPDGTADLVRSLMPHYANLSLLMREKKEGLGKAYIHAFKHMIKDPKVRSVIMMDADLSHDPAQLPEMLTSSEKYSVVVGSRYIKGGAIVGWELWRQMLSYFGNHYCKIITRMPIHECTGGYNLIKIELLNAIDFDKFDSSGYAFIMELKYSLHKAGAQFKEIPIIFKNRIGGESKISNHIITEGIIAPWKMILKK